jgi:hypothetical protein
MGDGTVMVQIAPIVLEAQRRLEALEAWLAPGRFEVAGQWLADFNDATLLPRRPGAAEEMFKAVCGIWETCAEGGVPAICWSRESRIAFQAAQRLWPSPADVFQHMAKVANPMRREHLARRGTIQAAK